jgi:two-component system phosphate regulon sensor histidine kinase PhoR
VVSARQAELLALLLIAVAAAAAWFLPPIGSAGSVAVAGVGAILLSRHAAGQRRAAAADAMRETVTSAIADPILIVRDGRVQHANAAARHLLGNIVGKEVRSAIDHPGARDRIAARDPGAPLELVGLANRRQRWLMRLSDYQGARYVHLTDATAVYAAEQMRVDFIANASHELRTPLATILGFVETLRDPEAGGDPALRERFLGLVFDQATRMRQLVSDLISLSRIEAEKTQAPTERVNLGTVARTVAQEARKLDDGDGGGDIHVDIGSYFALVPGDEALLKQMLHNLIGNARRYGRSGTPVTIRIWQESADTVGLSVTDEGEGIAPEHLPRLTERFYRADSSRSRALAGTGLGLAIVKHVVEHHRGRLNIASELGVGTTVSIYLPAVIEP